MTSAIQHNKLMVKGTHDPREMNVFVATGNGKLHGDFMSRPDEYGDRRQCWDIEFPNVIQAAKWASRFDRYFYAIDFRDDQRVSSLYAGVTLTAACFNEGE